MATKHILEATVGSIGKSPCTLAITILHEDGSNTFLLAKDQEHFDEMWEMFTQVENVIRDGEVLIHENFESDPDINALLVTLRLADEEHPPVFIFRFDSNWKMKTL